MEQKTNPQHICKKCQGIQSYVFMNHSIHESNMPLCGGGEVGARVPMWYCPKCDPKPNVFGSPMGYHQISIF